MAYFYKSDFWRVRIHITLPSTILTCLLVLTNIIIAQAQWTRKADEISKRAEGNNVLYNNKLYVFSGFGDNPVIEKTNEVYDIAANKWSQIAPFPSGRLVTHQGIILVDDNIWIIGGREIDAHGPASSKVSIYNITTNTWSNGPEIIDPATGAAFPMGAGGYGLLGRIIHVFGGFGPTMCEDQATLHLTIDVDKYMDDRNTVTWENKLKPMPIPRNHISYVVLGGKIYAFGGQFKHDCGAVDQKYCQVYDPLTDTWKTLTDLPIPRSHAEAATFAVDGKIYLVAGQGYNNVTQNTVYQFNPEANNGLGSWTLLSAYKLPGSFLGLSSKLAAASFIITNGALSTYDNERKETYIANITRSATRTLGFSNPCLSLTLDASLYSTVHNLLYVIENTTTYSIKSSVPWLTIIKNGRGSVNLNGNDIQVAIDATGLSAGNYTGNITATGTTAASKASFCVNIIVGNSDTNYKLTTNTKGLGTITKTPDQPSYNPGSKVLLNATPADGWHFNGWSGDAISDSNPLIESVTMNTAITANFISNDTSALISDIKSTTGRSYQLSSLNNGTTYYTDRDYVVLSVPFTLTGAAFIKTANDDKTSKANALLTFNISQPATVYVAYDPRTTSLPGWLAGWKQLTDHLGVSDTKVASFTLYSKVFSAGSVSLGGNAVSPEAGSLSQYVVACLAVPSINNLAKTIFNKASVISALQDAANTELKSATSNKSGIKPMLFPNPARNTLRVVFPDKYNYKGAIVLRVVGYNGDIYPISKNLFQFSGNVVDLNIAPLALKTGIYLLHLTSIGGKTDIIKFIVL